METSGQSKYKNILNNHISISISEKDRQIFTDNNYNFTYGTLTRDGFDEIISKLDISTLKNKKFVDLGSGDGRVSIWASEYFEMSYGIELSEERYLKSQENKKIHNIKNVEFHNMDILKFDISDMNVIYVSNLCFDKECIKKVSDKFSKELKNTIVFSSKMFPSSVFKKKINVKQSWTNNSNIYMAYYGDISDLLNKNKEMPKINNSPKEKQNKKYEAIDSIIESISHKNLDIDITDQNINDINYLKKQNKLLIGKIQEMNLNIKNQKIINELLDIKNTRLVEELNEKNETIQNLKEEVEYMETSLYEVLNESIDEISNNYEKQLNKFKSSSLLNNEKHTNVMNSMMLFMLNNWSIYNTIYHDNDCEPYNIFDELVENFK